MSDNYYSEVNENGVVTPLRDLAAFPRSEQAVLGAKNIWDDSIEMLGNASGVVTKTSNGYTIQTNTSDFSGGNFVQTPLRTKYTPFGDIIVSFEYKSDIACAGYIGNKSVDTMATDWIKVSYSTSGSTMGAICFYNRDTTKAPLIEMRNMQITLASDTDLTYVEPAMTNRELTDKAVIKSDITTSADSRVTISDEYKTFYRQGNVVNCRVRFTTSAAISESVALFTVPYPPIIENFIIPIFKRDAPFGVTDFSAYISWENKAVLNAIGNSFPTGTYEWIGTYICK